MLKNFLQSRKFFRSTKYFGQSSASNSLDFDQETALILQEHSTANIFKDNALFDEFSTKFEGKYLQSLFPAKGPAALQTFTATTKDKKGVSTIPIDIDSINKSIYDPANYLLSNGGKRWRPYLTWLYSKTFTESTIVQNLFGNAIGEITGKLSDDQIFSICALGETLHNAS